MYLYFNRYGTLKEFINDKPLRQGNVNVNEVYVYIDSFDLDDINQLDSTYLLADENVLTKQDIQYTKVVEKIPANKDRDLKFFTYYKEYTFIKFTIPSDVLEVPGATSCTIGLVLNDAYLELDNFAFMIQASAVGKNYVASDEYVSLAQYHQLLIRIANATSNIPDASQNARGLMTPSQYNKLLSVETGATRVEVIKQILEDNDNAISSGAVFDALKIKLMQNLIKVYQKLILQMLKKLN